MISVLGWPAFINRLQNPYNHLLYTAMRERGARVDEVSIGRMLLGRYDILHVHWPELAYSRHGVIQSSARAVAALLLIAWMKLRGTSVVWTVHNLRSHDQRHPRLERAFFRAFIRMVDGVIGISATGLEMAEELYPRLRSLARAIVPIGHYKGYYGPTEPIEIARESLGVAANVTVIGSFGRVRAYKNLEALVAAFSKLQRTDVELFIAGDPSPDVDTAKLRGVRVRFDAIHVPENQVPRYHSAVNVVVLPYRDILNSASAVLALSCERPIVVPNVPTMRELQEQVGPDWVKLFEPPLSEVELDEAVAWATGPRSALNLEPLSWDRLAGRTMTFFEELSRR